ncbi:DUF2063 domain-containing protein [Oceaniserpentilla sp. 4NH20-0058]|uniref:HvfC family RiPP maturation protein n=1 Tax=Oceaniserpentilla sp. 4NH20-0058 TaxID=3127660 RepID=UPI00310341C4
MPETNYKDTQQEFTDAIRSPEQGSIDGIEERRLAVYRELFINNVESFITGTFPVLKECLNQKTWSNMVRRFFVEHKCTSPYFLEISEEFLEFLGEDEGNTLDLPDYAYSLAHWEWMELFADAYVEQKPFILTPINLDHDCLTTVECAWLQAYEFPVHTIGANQTVEQAPTFLLVYRDQSQEVNFIELNPLSYLLFQALQNNQLNTIKGLVHDISQANGIPAEQLMTGAMEIIGHWADLQLIQKV